MKTLAVIPCRFASSRFPGKPLADIHGKPMMWHVYQRCLESSVFDEICIATDDQRIMKAGEELGLFMVLTANTHVTGTDRVAEVSDKINADYYVNVQGDEPFIEPQAIKAVVNVLMSCKDETVMASNAYSILESCTDILSPNTVKVIFDKNHDALAYSRYPIPYPQSAAGKYYRQLGLYAFKKEGLDIFKTGAPMDVERSEGVEMFRFLEHGYKVKMVETIDNSVSVDTQQDLERVRNMQHDV